MNVCVMRLRLAGSLLAALSCLAACSGCLAPAGMPADQAFALSASALAGSDRYSFSGEYTVMNEGGTMERRRQFRGEVAGHRLAALQWEASSARQPDADGGTDPLSLMEAVQLQAAAVAYEPSGANTVALMIALKPEAARARAVDLLRADLKASKQRDEALQSLKATTVCRWTADRRTWFPAELKEETVLQYRIGGAWRTQKRASITHFRRRADSAIINQEEGH
ncbi:hypothetical protein COLU111180_04975 [Cohnella lubricantis]|uniref:DUF1318 domain-containing protein n=1 Tax=Cohnella lubricantis TaxID=2163172 RepID=A0A841TE29_9BACL|nr:hypothetical protein [Cohnella lubricantis]MBB6677237.1 hypothetical protein [Cohnella lubricantis]MBP2116953.1 hypothetical protein [Cohnella lubricantis]